MANYALQFEEFKNIISKTSCSLPATEKHALEDRTFTTTNDLLKEKSRYYISGTYGIKTGYTKYSKNCIVAGCKRGDLDLICVILGAGQTDTGLSVRNLDCKTLFEYGFENFALKQLSTKSELLKTIEIENGVKDNNTLNILIQDNLQVLCSKENVSSLVEPLITLNSELVAPIFENTVLGTISYTVDGTIYSSKLIAGNTVYKASFPSNRIIFIAFIVLLVLGIIIFLFKKRIESFLI